MELFKSKYKRRIEAKIKYLAYENAKIMIAKQNTNQIRNTTDYCKLVIAESDFQKQIDLLKSLL